MQYRFTRIKTVHAALLLLLIASACTTRDPYPYTGAIAPVAAPITFSDRGTVASLALSVSELVSATELAFRDMGITIVDRDHFHDRVVLTGSQGEWKVVVDVGRASDEVLTTADVTVSRFGTDFSRSRAEQTLRTILNRAGERAR